MSFAPPPGPPPPPVPPGWKAQYDDRYKQWFFINLKTGVSQWTAPEEASSSGPPSDAPPLYSGPGNAASDDKSRLGSNNPYSHSTTSRDSSGNVDEDAKLAARLQAEEDARARGLGGSSDRPGSRGASSDYYSGSSPSIPSRPDSGSSPLPPDDRQRGARGLLGKVFGKSSSSSQPQQGYGGGGYGHQQQQYPPQQQQYGYGGPPQPQYGYPPQQGYPPQGGYYPPGPGYGGYGPGPGYGYPPQQQQQQGKTSGGGMGTMGAAALGVGGGLLAGALITDAVEDHDDNEYQQGYDQGYDDGGDGGDF